MLDWSSASDAGRTLHPDLLKAQLQGGIAQGIGESGVTPAAAAIAVHDAIGVPITTLPSPPEKVLAAIDRRQVTS